jgi:transposase
LQGRHDQLEREMRRKDRALAEAAALLILQKKFQALVLKSQGEDI